MRIAHLFLLASAAVHATAALPQALPSWLTKSEEIIRQAQEHAIDADNADPDQSDESGLPALPAEYQQLKPKINAQTREMAKAIADRADRIRYLATEKHLSADEIVKEMKQNPAPTATPRTPPVTENEQLAKNWNTDAAYIFVSQSMPPAEIKAAFQMSADTGAIVVLRGVRKSESIDQLALAMEPHVADRNRPPVIAIDPASFKEFDIQSVPVTLVRHNGKTVRTKGIIDIDYLLNQIVEGHKDGELPPVGPTYEIAEEDIADEIKRRIEAIDWEKQKQGAVDRMWTNGHWKPIPLPTQEKSTQRLYDPTVEYKTDVLGPDNQVVIAAGTRINPLDHVKLIGHLIVFDGTDKKQMAQVKRWITAHANVDAFMLIANNMDIAKASAGMAEMRSYFSRPVMLANAHLIERFDVRRVPYIAYSSGNKLVIHELGSKE